MSTQISSELVGKEILDFLEETFEKVSGIYLDRETSFLETLAKVNAAEASKPIVESGTTIAGQVEHVRFYLRILNDAMSGKTHPNLDWKQSWLVKRVTDSEWTKLQQQLRDDYRQLQERWKSIEDWSAEDQLGGALAIVVHTAYHLGAIRQILRVVK